MSQSFSTDLVPVSDRLEAWLYNAKPTCGDCRFHFPRCLPFHGSIERRSLAGFDLTRFASTPLSFAKFPVVAGDSEERGCIVITQLKGMRQYCQSGAMALLTAGDTTLIDSGRPWTSDCADDCIRLYLRVPRWLVQERVRTSSLPMLPRISGKSGLGATLFRLATSLYEQAEEMNPQDGLIAVEAYLDILAGCFARPESAATRMVRCAQLRPRVEYFIETHLQDPALCPAGIAAAASISVRHLHRLFAAKGCTVAEWIRERRLERCRTDLSDPHLREHKITDIAFGWGFSDSAHFSHCFKQEFGVSPREFRSSVGTWKPQQIPLPARTQLGAN